MVLVDIFFEIVNFFIREELNHFMRAYMFRYVGRMRYDRLA